MNFEEYILKCKNDIVYFAEHMVRAEDGSFYKLEEHQKAMVSSKISPVVYFCGRRLGKSFMLAIECIHRALFYKYQRVFVLSPTENQAKELAETITGMIERSELIENEVITNNVMEKKFKNGSRIVIRTGGGKGSVSSVIGSGANLLIIDEIQDVPDSLIGKIIPVMRGQKGDSKFIVAGTPRAKTGFLYESLESAPDIWDNGVWKHRDDKNGNFTVFRKQTAYMDKDDNIIASGTPRITIDELREDYLNIGAIEFKQEYCLEFMSSVTDVYSLELQRDVLYNETDDKFKSNKLVVYGIDIGMVRNNTILYIAEVGDEPDIDERTLKLKYKKVWPLGTDYDEIEDYIIYELPRRFPNIRRGVFDATGVGLAIYNRVAKAVKKSRNPYPVEDFTFSIKTKKEIVEYGVSAMQAGRVKIQYSDKLHDEMTGYKREITNDNNFIYIKGAGSDDYVDSMNLCIYNMALGLNFKPPVFIKQMPKIMTRNLRGNKEWQDKEFKQRPKRQSKKMIKSPRRRL